MTKLRNTIAASALLVPVAAFATLYQIVGTDQFVNGVPPSLTVKERAKLVTTTITKTESSCLANKCVLVDKAKAKAKIKAIILAESVPICTPPSVLNTATNNCETPAPVSLMPKVDITKNITPNVGFSVLRVQPTTEIAPNSDIGAFRISCAASHMNNDDPMVFPNQQNATHHHTYFGNTSVKYDTDLTKLSTTGNSTCHGGIMNRSAYWTPSMIDTATNSPVIPQGTSFYYKRGYHVPVSHTVMPPPAGLRMLAGNPKATIASEGAALYKCNYPNKEGANSRSIPLCSTGGTLNVNVMFPQCWDGKNLDSPNHKDHMAYPHNDYPTANKCPATHPVPIPEIVMNLNFVITKENQTATWRLASDNYAYNGSNAGYSGHADWVDGWNRTFITDIVNNCINGKKDSHNHLLCDGRTFY